MAQSGRTSGTRKSGGGGNARKRSSSGAKKKVSAAARGRAAVEERARIRLEIASIALIAVGAFLIFALFSEASGKAGAALDTGLSGAFGLMARAFPFFLIAYGAALIVGFVRGANTKRVVLIAAIFILLCILFGDSGGAVGANLAKWLENLIGNAGRNILCVALIAILGILLTGVPLSRTAGKAREKGAAIREARQERIEARRSETGEVSGAANGAGVSASDVRSSGAGLFRFPSFLGGGTAGAPAQSDDTDNRKHIIDAVKNDEIYGDAAAENEIEIVDNTPPFIPDPPASAQGAAREQASQAASAVKPPPKRAAGAMRFSADTDDSNYKLPPVDLLTKSKGKAQADNPAELKASAVKLEQALREFNVGARVAKVTVGPTVTRYEVEPDVGVKIQSIRSLEDDLALKLEVKSVRVVSMPGHAVVGIEAYNSNTSIVALREMIDSEEFREASGAVCFALGKNISGKRIIVDLKEMPHLLIAGTTGSGKSVCINTILLSILYRAKPSEVKLILVDPKVVELKSYNDLPHLLVPVVTDPERAATALSYAVTIMGDRYKKFAEHNVRNLESYNEKMRREGLTEEVLPQIVIIIDELSDLMMVASAKVQESISRLAAMARAAGMHLIVATQQPLASILTSVIKANIPSRVAFAVSSNSASRVILDNPGAERLHGKGDMLFSPVGTRDPMRVQGAFVDESEVVKVVNFVKKQMNPDYNLEIMSQVDAAQTGAMVDDGDEFFLDAVEMAAQSAGQAASVSMLQRRFRIGYNRAARLVDMMEERGIVAASDGTNKPRRLIMSEGQLASFLASARGGGAEAFGAIEAPIEDEPYDEDVYDERDSYEPQGDSARNVTWDDLDSLDDGEPE